MATILGLTYRYLDTDKGKLYFPFITVDSIPQDAFMGFTNANDFLINNAENNNVFISQLTTQIIQTNFSSTDGTVYVRSNNPRQLRFNKNGYSGYIEYGLAAHYCGTLPILFTDGTKYALSPGITSDYTLSSVDKYTSNTENQFGLLVRNNMHPTGGYIDSGAINKGTILFEASAGLPTDPYSGAGDSGEGGGGGTFDGSSDPVPIPNLPPIGATDTGFISLFVPTMSQLNQVASYLWSPALDISTFKKIFENPMDCILGLSVVPVTVPTSGNAAITVGNVELSGIYLPLASQQYIELDCGTVDFTDKFFGSYLDQDPYTKMALFVPYSGVHAVNADDIMGKVIGLKYHIDILTGSLVAFVMCGDSVLYEFNGACASNIPVNSINYASTIENAIRIAVNIGTTVATAGAAAPMTGAEAAGREAARTFGTAVNMAGSTAEGILSLKPNIDRAGSLGGTSGLMGNQRPYFIITRPRLCKPKDQNKIKGYPSFIETTVADLVDNGYTEFDSIILEGLYLTNAEKEELLTILKSGVYL